MTRITDFQPGYLYGVLAGLVVRRPPSASAQRAGSSAIAVSAVAGVGVVAFLALGVVRALEGDGGPTGGWIPIDVLLSALVIGGFEGLLFGMVPLTGLPGATVKAWNARIWALLLFLGALGFLHVIVNPSSGYMVDSAGRRCSRRWRCWSRSGSSRSACGRGSATGRWTAGGSVGQRCGDRR